MTEKLLALLTPKAKERIVLLGLGSAATLLTVTFTLFFDQYLLRADYNKDEMVKVRLFTKASESSRRIEDKIDAIAERVERIDKRVNKLMDK